MSRKNQYKGLPVRTHNRSYRIVIFTDQLGYRDNTDLSYDDEVAILNDFLEDLIHQSTRYSYVGFLISNPNINYYECFNHPYYVDRPYIELFIFQGTAKMYNSVTSRKKRYGPEINRKLTGNYDRLSTILSELSYYGFEIDMNTFTDHILYDYENESKIIDYNSLLGNSNIFQCVNDDFYHIGFETQLLYVKGSSICLEKFANNKCFTNNEKFIYEMYNTYHEKLFNYTNAEN